MNARLVYRPQSPNTFDPRPQWFEVTREMNDMLLGPTKAAQDAARAAYRKLMDAPTPGRKVA
jgi:hypothetical protein